MHLFKIKTNRKKHKWKYNTKIKKSNQIIKRMETRQVNVKNRIKIKITKTCSVKISKRLQSLRYFDNLIILGKPNKLTNHKHKRK